MADIDVVAGAGPAGNLERWKDLTGGVYAKTVAAVLVSGGVVDTELPAAALLADGTALPTTPLVGALGELYNGTTADLARSAINAANTVGTGVSAVGLLAQLDDTSPTVLTENRFGNVWLDSARVLRANPEGQKATYGVSVTALAPAITATDIFTLIGSATKTVRITRIQISGVATAAGAYAIQIIKRSTADTTGTSTAPTVVPHDSANAAGTAVAAAYTANPGALGTAVGTLQVKRITVSTGAGAIPIVPTVFDFGPRSEQAIVLRGVAENLAINLNGATMTGGLLDIDLTFTEEV